MKFPRQFEPGDEDLPEGWDPARDRDIQWDAMVELMRQADAPRMPLPAQVDAMRMDVRRRLLADGTIRASADTTATADPGFMAWLRNLLLGGGPGAQVVRFGFIGALAFVAGSNIPPGGAVPRDATMIAAPPTTAAPQGNIGADSPAGTTTAAAVPVSGNRIGKSMTDDTLTIPDDGWGYPPSMQHTVSAAGGQAIDRSVLANDAIEQLQALKLRLLVSDDRQSLDRLRALESTMATLMRQAEDARSSRTRAVEVYFEADRMMRAQNYSRAMELLEQVVRMDPGSNLAVTARFLEGVVAYEKLQQYDVALDAFNSCLKDFPDHRISPEYMTYLRDRVQVLEETRAENWKSLKLWQSVQGQVPANEAVDALVQVVVESPSLTLAAEATRQLKGLLIGDASNRVLNAEGVAKAIQTRLAAAPDGVEAGRMWGDLGEILAQRLERPEESGSAYRRSVELLRGDARRPGAKGGMQRE